MLVSGNLNADLSLRSVRSSKPSNFIPVPFFCLFVYMLPSSSVCHTYRISSHDAVSQINHFLSDEDLAIMAQNIIPQDLGSNLSDHLLAMSLTRISQWGFLKGMQGIEWAAKVQYCKWRKQICGVKQVTILSVSAKNKQKKTRLS